MVLKEEELARLLDGGGGALVRALIASKLLRVEQPLLRAQGRESMMMSERGREGKGEGYARMHTCEFASTITRDAGHESINVSFGSTPSPANRIAAAIPASTLADSF